MDTHPFVDITPQEDGSPADRLVNMLLRCAKLPHRECPWEQLDALARKVARGRDDMPARGRNQRIGFALALAVAERVRVAEDPATAIVPMLPLLWRLDRKHGVHPFDHIAALLPQDRRRDAAAVCEMGGHALLRLLGRHDPSIPPHDEDGARLLSDLASTTPLPFPGEQSGRLDWPSLCQGISRHLRMCRVAEGAGAVARFVRSCPSRVALSHLVHSKSVREDPLLITTLLFRGTAREIAVGLAALHNAAQHTRTRAVVAQITVKEPWLASRRMALVFDLLHQLPAPEPEFEAALLWRAAKAPGETDPSPVTSDQRLPSRCSGRIEAALLTEGAGLLDLPDARSMAEVVDTLLAMTGSVLTQSDGRPALAASHSGALEEPAVGRDQWAAMIGRALLAVWRRDAARQIGDIPFGRTLMVSLARMEMGFHLCPRPGDSDRQSGSADKERPLWAPRGLLVLVLTMARGLPPTKAGRLQAKALFEIVLRLTRRHPEAVESCPQLAPLADLLASAPDPLDHDQADQLGAFLDRLCAMERGEGLTLPQPDGIHQGGEHTLGVARLSA